MFAFRLGLAPSSISAHRQRYGRNVWITGGRIAGARGNAPSWPVYPVFGTNDFGPHAGLRGDWRHPPNVRANFPGTVPQSATDFEGINHEHDRCHRPPRLRCHRDEPRAVRTGVPRTAVHGRRPGGQRRSRDRRQPRDDDGPRAEGLAAPARHRAGRHRGGAGLLRRRRRACPPTTASSATSRRRARWRTAAGARPGCAWKT